jgi:hypothetical protein
MTSAPTSSAPERNNFGRQRRIVLETMTDLIRLALASRKLSEKKRHNQHKLRHYNKILLLPNDR